MNPLAGKTLVVLNTSTDTINLLTSWFEAAGMTVHGAAVDEFRDRGRDLAAFVAISRPDVIVFDVALPYVRNWKFLQSMRAGPLAGIPLIVTTPNARVLQTVSDVFEPGVPHEIVGKPADMEQLTATVTEQILAIA